MKGCDMYQRIKNKMEVPVGKLKLSEVLEKPWIHLIVNFIYYNLGLVNKKNLILVNTRELDKELCTRLPILYML